VMYSLSPHCKINVNLLIVLLGFFYLWVSDCIGTHYAIPFPMLRNDLLFAFHSLHPFAYGDDLIVIYEISSE